MADLSNFDADFAHIFQEETGRTLDDARRFIAAHPRPPHLDMSGVGAALGVEDEEKRKEAWEAEVTKLGDFVRLHRGEYNPGFGVRPQEPGGAVNMGVSFEALQYYCRKHGLPPPTYDDLARLTVEQAESIYIDDYARAVRYPDLPRGVDYLMFDAAITMGRAGAGRFLRAVLDGEDIEQFNPNDVRPHQITDEHLERIRTLGAREVCNRLLDGWLPAKRNSGKDWRMWWRGWSNRNRHARARVDELLGSTDTRPLPPGA